ncbi:Methylmalonyl-CoA mutase [subsurface metagenome]
MNTAGAGFGTPEETKKRLEFVDSKRGPSAKFRLEGTGFPDLPTELGYDPDSPMAEGEVGVVGASTPSLKEMEILYDGVPMDRARAGGLGQTGVIRWAMGLAVAKKRGVPVDKLRFGGIGDALFEYYARGNYIWPIEPYERICLDHVSHRLQGH